MDENTVNEAIKKINQHIQESSDSMLRMQGYMAGLNKAREQLEEMLRQETIRQKALRQENE